VWDGDLDLSCSSSKPTVWDGEGINHKVLSPPCGMETIPKGELTKFVLSKTSSKPTVWDGDSGNRASSKCLISLFLRF
jgi:hypothetical protein